MLNGKIYANRGEMHGKDALDVVDIMKYEHLVASCLYVLHFRLPLPPVLTVTTETGQRWMAQCLQIHR